MARFQRPPLATDGAALPREQQLSLFERLGNAAKAIETEDPAPLAQRLFLIVLALLGLGLVMQVNHAATTQPAEEFWALFSSQMFFRIAALVALVLGFRLGPQGLRQYIPALTVLTFVALLLVFVPGFAASRNGAHRWIELPFVGVSFQPSELARIVMILWVADRCIRLGPDVLDMRRGLLPMLAVGFLFFFTILIETDLGGSLLFMVCFVSTLWMGGADFAKMAGPVAGIGGTAVLLVVTCVGYIRHRMLMWFGSATNHQVERSADAIASGDFFGVGLGQGLYRNARVPYLDTDYVFALVGEELGLFGMLVLLGLFLAFTWTALRLVLSIKDRYAALCAFGLLLSVCVQAMVHMQVVTRLAPPKGMPLPFISHGGTALVVSSLAVGLALGAARSKPDGLPR
ncbi:MAG: FtsW/RodA/SpoVE family cell cycle protein [Planctomycetes bacterium]|nr:FtsW/RodA/SpoVE family cell cycle protein [Planctomycetota bacterium]